MNIKINKVENGYVTQVEDPFLRTHVFTSASALLQYVLDEIGDEPNRDVLLVPKEEIEE